MNASIGTDVVGWVATGVLVLTIGKQAYSQWKDGSTEGQSKWLFVGQLAASTGFVVYSWLLGNVVFVVSNVFMLLIAAAGQVVYVRNRRREGKSAADDT